MRPDDDVVDFEDDEPSHTQSRRSPPNERASREGSYKREDYRQRQASPRREMRTEHRREPFIEDRNPSRPGTKNRRQYSPSRRYEESRRGHSPPRRVKRMNSPPRDLSRRMQSPPRDMWRQHRRSQSPPGTARPRSPNLPLRRAHSPPHKESRLESVRNSSRQDEHRRQGHRNDGNRDHRGHFEYSQDHEKEVLSSRSVGTNEGRESIPRKSIRDKSPQHRRHREEIDDDDRASSNRPSNRSREYESLPPLVGKRDEDGEIDNRKAKYVPVGHDLSPPTKLAHLDISNSGTSCVEALFGASNNRFFLARCNFYDIFVKTKRTSVWRAPEYVVDRMRQAAVTADNLILLFTVHNTGYFQGVALYDRNQLITFPSEKDRLAQVPLNWLYIACPHIPGMIDRQHGVNCSFEIPLEYAEKLMVLFERRARDMTRAFNIGGLSLKDDSKEEEEEEEEEDKLDNEEISLTEAVVTVEDPCDTEPVPGGAELEINASET